MDTQSGSSVMEHAYSPPVALVRFIPLHVVRSHVEVLREIDRHIRTDRQTEYISITDSVVLYAACRMPDLAELIKSARFSLCDSITVVLSGLLEGHRLRRYTGPLLMLDCMAFGLEQHWRHFFYGGPPGLADLLSQRLTARFPGLITAGTLCSKFRDLTPEEEDKLVDAINQVKPDILWVGLGAIRQDVWIAQYRHRLKVPWIIGVGGAFDCHAGLTRWAPAWIRAIGMEWFYRYCQEPWRCVRGLRVLASMLEAVLETILRRRVLLGNRTMKMPVFHGRVDAVDAQPPVSNSTR